jgi:hypothetical protein
VVGPGGGQGLRAGIRAAAAEGAANWLWLLDASVVPQEDTLDALLGFAADPGGLPAPLVLASRVVEAAGVVCEASLPQHEFRRSASVVDACRQRVMAIRAARSGSVLVRAGLTERFGLPRRGLSAQWALFDWTARVLRGAGDAGYLVPSSVARSLAPGASLTAERRSRLVMLAGPAWRPVEWRREAYVLATDVMAGSRRAPRA